MPRLLSGLTLNPALVRRVNRRLCSFRPKPLNVAARTAMRLLAMATAAPGGAAKYCGAGLRDRRGGR